MIDLHCHSTFSDGTFTPEELIDSAEDIGLTAVALTDHDTVLGIPRALEAARGKRVRFVPGVEISGEIEHGALHILGLFVDHRNETLNQMLAFAENERYQRNVTIAKRLQQIGMDVTIEEVAHEASPGVMGRPHFATIMLRKGYVASMEEAFHRYLGKGGAAFVPKTRIPRAQAISVIRGASGVPVLAHPDQTHRAGKELDDLLAELARLGLLGIETHYSGYNVDKTRQYRRLAEKHGLLESGGSDFHGAVKPRLALGLGPGNLHVPDTFLDGLVEAAGKLSRSGSI